LFDDRIGREHKRLRRMLARGAVGLPPFVDQFPEQGGKQKARTDGFSCTHAGIGTGKRELNELLAAVLLEDDVDQWKQPFVQTYVLQLPQAIHGMPASEQLEDFIEKPGRWHVFDETCHAGD